MPSGPGTAARAPTTAPAIAARCRASGRTVPRQRSSRRRDRLARGGVEQQRARADHGAGYFGPAARAVARARPQDARGAAGRPRAAAALAGRCISCGGACCSPSATPPAGAPNDEHFVALRLEALYRSGLLSDMEAVLKDRPAPGPVVETLRARRDIGLGQRETGCQTIKALAAPELRPARPPQGRDAAAGRLLRRGCRTMRTAPASPPSLPARRASRPSCRLAVLAAFAAGSKPKLALPKRVLLLDYRFLELLGPVNAHAASSTRPSRRCSPTLAGDPQVRRAPADRGRRGGAAAQRPAARSRRRRSIAASPCPAGPARPIRRRQARDPLLRRALFFQAAEAGTRAGTARALPAAILDDARRSGSLPADGSRRGTAAGRPAAVARAFGQFAETVVEIALAAGEFGQARQWAESAGPVALAGADRCRRSRAARRPAARRSARWRTWPCAAGSAPEALHKLATVLDALDIDVPIADLGCGQPHAAAVERLPAGDRHPGRPCAVGQAATMPAAPSCSSCARWAPDGPDGANLLALGDAIRALQAHRPRSGRPPAGAGGAAAGLAARGRPTDDAGAMTTAAPAAAASRPSCEMLAAERGAAGTRSRPTGATSRISSASSSAAGRLASGGRAPADIGAYLRALSRGRPGAGLARAAAVGAAPALQVPGRRRA